MRARTNGILLAVAVLLTGYVLLFERGSPTFTQGGKVFKDLVPEDITEIEISRPSLLKDAALGIDTRPIRLRREGSPPEWWIVEPIRYEAYHPRTQAIAYDLADLTRAGDVPQGSEAAVGGDVELLVKIRTRQGEEHRIEVGADHPDPKLDLSYLRVDGQTLVARRGFRKSMNASLTDLRTRALLGIAPPDAVSLTIGGDPRFEKVLVRDGSSDRWRLKKPLDASADTELVESLLKTLNGWSVAQFVKDDASAEDIAQFGLDSPQATVTLRHRNGKEIVLEVGKPAPPAGDEQRVHVRHRGETMVFAAAAAPVARLTEAPDVLRSRYLFDIGLEDVEELTTELGASRLVLRREKGAAGKALAAWQALDASGKLLFPADQKDMDDVLVALRKLLIQKFVPKDLGTPAGSLQLRLSSGRRLEAKIGGLSDAPEDRGQNMYTVAVPGEPGSYVVSWVLPARLREGPIAFRRKDVSDLDPARVLEMEIVSGGRSWMMARTGAGDPWMLSLDAQPQPGKELNPKLVDACLLELHKDGFRVERYLPDLTDFAARGLELQSPSKAIVLARLDGKEPSSLRKLVLGDVVEGSNPVEVRARLDAADLPPFTLEKEILDRFDALVAHLTEITAKP